MTSPRQESGRTKRERSRVRLLSALLDALAEGVVEPVIPDLAVRSGLGRATAYGLFDSHEQMIDVLQVFGFARGVPSGATTATLNQPLDVVFHFVNTQDPRRAASIKLVSALTRAIEISRFAGLHVIELLGRVVLTEAFLGIGRDDEAVLQLAECADLLGKYASGTTIGAISAIRLGRATAIAERSFSSFVEFNDLGADWASEAQRFDITAIAAAELLSSRWYFGDASHDHQAVHHTARLHIERAIARTEPMGESGSALRLLGKLASPRVSNEVALARFVENGGVSPWNRLFALESLSRISSQLAVQLRDAVDPPLVATGGVAHQTPAVSDAIRRHLRCVIDGDLSPATSAGLIDLLSSEIARVQLGGSLPAPDRSALLSSMRSLAVLLEDAPLD